MRKQLLISCFAAVLSIAMIPASADTAAARGAYADVNGIHMYYEEHGPKTGVPLVLLHGGGSTIDVTFGRVLPFLARSHRIIAVEEQGHGRTSDRNAPVRFETSADDVAALLEHLHVPQADLFGFSNGASVAMQVAIRHPTLVRNLIFASAMTRRDGARSELWAFIDKGDFSMMPQPLKDAFLEVTPDPVKLKVMHDKDAARMRGFRDVADQDVKSIRARTLVLIGDRDVVRPEHAVELTHLIPDARLMIVPGGHGDYIGEALTKPEPANFPELTAAIVAAFIG